jgi:chemotaxis protein methyltransferase CheR
VALHRSTLARLAGALGAHAGLELPEWVIESRAKERMSALGLTAERYVDLISAPKGAHELAELVEAVRVGETRFFRHKPQVDAVLEVVVPSWKARNVARPRIWSAGCASGEEPYTLALVLAKALPSPAFAVSILATDVSAEAVRAAKRGAYPRNTLEQVPPPYRDGVVLEGDSLRIRPDIASLVSFECQNLATGDIQRGLDLVWCRNVLIYFEPSARRKVLHRIVDALSPGGFLFLGYSETLRGVAGLSPVHHGDQVLWQKAPRAHSTPPHRPSKPKEMGHREVAKKVHKPAPRSPALPHPALPKKEANPQSSRRGNVHIAVTDSSALRSEVATALSHGGLGALTIDLDAAPFLEDDVAPVLRRACAAAEAAGIRVVLRAERPGAKRWLRRNGLAGDDA